MPLTVESVTQQVLFQRAQESGAVRGGATISPKATKTRYEGQGYGGTLFVATTLNMKAAEDRLLAIRDFRHNVQKLSNVQEEPGFIYVIKGRKFRR